MVVYEDGDQEEMDNADIARYKVEVVAIDDDDDDDNAPPAPKKFKPRDKQLWEIQKLHPRVLDRAKIADYDTTTTQAVADFFLFVYERQMIWHRRFVAKQVAPWSQLPIFQELSFCNVYRELDRGTTFFHAHIMDLWDTHKYTDQRAWTQKVLWTTYVYRQVNRVSSFQELGFPDLTVQSVEDFIVRVRDFREENRDEPFFTGCHQTTNHKTFASNLQKVVADEAQMLKDVLDRLLAAPTLRQCITALRDLPNIGNFLSWQLLCDLRESQCLTCVTQDVETYCALGPGAMSKL